MGMMLLVGNKLFGETIELGVAICAGVYEHRKQCPFVHKILIAHAAV